MKYDFAVIPPTNISQNLPDGSAVSQAERKAAFLKAVTAETEADVFRNFVRDVLEN